ncbi:MAG: type II toxin-antitoxin system HicA family toxin [Candidatus Kapaibacterium sp.]|nr:MAG: type II toxin-antitoxin system HicA family toxin [Candidatus Kapabacteria bacterium]
MSERLPVVSGKEFVRMLEGLGWVVRRQTGSHIMISQDKGQRTISVPNHRMLDKGILHSLIKKAGLTTKEFRTLL